MLVIYLPTLYHQLMPRVRLFLFIFTLAGFFGVCEGVDVCVRPQRCGWKVVQVNIRARDSCTFSTLLLVSIRNITYNYWTNFAAQSLCSGLRRAVSRSLQCKTCQLSMRQCSIPPSTLHHQLMPRVLLLLIRFTLSDPCHWEQRGRGCVLLCVKKKKRAAG